MRFDVIANSRDQADRERKQSLRHRIALCLLLFCGTARAIQSTPSPATRQLFAAIEAGSESAAGRAIHEGADVEAQNDRGRRPLMQAAREGRVAIVRTLLNAGARPNARGDFR